MEKLVISWENIETYISNPIGYRFVDSADVIPGIEGWGRKVVSSQDWYFRIHFPGNPVMPGILVMETLYQTGLIIIKSLPNNDIEDMCFTRCTKMKMYNSVRPGDVLSTHVIVEEYCSGTASFHGEVKISRHGEEKELLVCTMQFVLQDKRDMLRNSVSAIQLPAISSDDVVVFDYSNIDNYLADPQEYRFIDRALVCSNMGMAEKCSSSLDWYYRYCNSVMPFGFIMESIMQTGVLIVTQRNEIRNPLMMFNDCDWLEIFSFVRPGDVLKTHVTMKTFRNGVAKYEGIAVVDDRKVCEMSFTLIHPEEIRKFSERLAKRRMNVDVNR